MDIFMVGAIWGQDEHFYGGCNLATDGRGEGGDGHFNGGCNLGTG